MAIVTVTAPAKVNLYLHVTGRRTDGYHLLESLVAFTEFGDELTVGPADDLTLTIDGPFADRLPDGPENLILQAASAHRGLCGVAAGAAIHLNKRIPVAAGIGGGSADAAAALKALSAFWQVDPDPHDLHDLALGLGADVPVCLRGRPTYMAGIGEDVMPAPGLPPMGVLLVNPMRTLSTPDVFRARQEDFGPADRMPEEGFQGEAAFLDALRHRRNDLTDPAIRIAPAIGEVLTALAGLPGCHLARMSGSGATCFALFDDERTARTQGERLAAKQPGWWVQPTGFLGTAPELNA